MADASLLGRFMWYELLTTDMKAAETFYKAVVGWGVTPFEGSPDPYDMWVRPDGAPMGGVMPLPEGMNVPPHWMLYVGVPRLEDGIAAVERLGGSGMSPVIDVPEVGRMRVMTDPQGAMFSIYEPTSPPQEPEGEPKLGDVSWHELYTSDLDGAITFYTTLFGWQLTEAMDMGEMGKYQMFGRAFPLGGMMKKAPEMAQMPSAWGIYFRVDDVHRAAERVTTNGGQILNGPMEVPGGDWIVNCVDPQGAAFSLHHRK